jgi:hypothetical protein
MESLEQKQAEAEEDIRADTESLEQRQDRLENVTSMAVESPLQKRAEEDIREDNCRVFIEAYIEEQAKEVGEEKAERCVEKGEECERTVKEEPDEESGQEAEPTTCFIEEDPLSR